MAHKFKLVQLNAKPGHPEEGKKFFAVSVSSGETTLGELCELISARSTVSSADVKAVLDSLNYVVDRELRAGRIVRLGELGSMRAIIGSKGADDEKTFTNQLIRKPRILFTPGKMLENTRKLMTFARLTADGEVEEGKEPAGSDKEPAEEGGGKTPGL